MILDDIVAKTRTRVAAAKETISPVQMKERALSHKSFLPEFAFEKALNSPDISFICEVKKASPSKGIIAEDFPYLQIAKDYEQAGATCISVLTEPDFFLGADKYLSEIRENVSIPLLRKDFVIDEYQIYQAKTLGADCVLLICSILDETTLRQYISICDSLGLSALVEAHDENEISVAIRAGARIIGVNNRNLKNFTVNVENSTELRKLVPHNILFVAESGIKSGKDINILRQNRVNAALIGETLMRASDKTAALASLRGTRIKICGLTREEDISIVNELKPDYIGFVFAGSRRQVSDETASRLKALLSSGIQAVGVFVNDTISHIEQLCKSGTIDIVQLHGDETPEYIEELKEKISLPIIKAIPSGNDVRKYEDKFSNIADYLLMDSMTKEAYGGTGKEIDLKYTPLRRNNLFIAGGVNAGNVDNIIDLAHPYAVDISSGVETDGYKDRNKIKEFIEKVRNHYE